jgi:hypothetical protein
MQLNLWQTGFLIGVFFSILFLPFSRTRWGDAGFKLFGWLFLLCLLGNHAERYLRGYWRLNAHLVPVPIIGPDGRHLDGTPANEFEQMESQAGNGRDVLAWLVMAGIGGGFVYCWHMIRVAERESRAHEERMQRLRELRRGIEQDNPEAVLEFYHILREKQEEAKRRKGDDPARWNPESVLEHYNRLRKKQEAQIRPGAGGGSRHER